MRFDYFACTFPRISDTFQDLKTGLLDMGCEFVHNARGMRNYKESATLKFEGGAHGSVAWGGNSGGISVHASGPLAQPFRDWVVPRQRADLERKIALRVSGRPEEAKEWARLTRADVCHDWIDERDVAALYPVLRPEVDAYCWRANNRSLTWAFVGDPDSHEGRARGCSIYIGARGSIVYIRIYDKGREMRNKDAEAPDDLRRVEIEYRPDCPAEKIEAVLWEPEKYFSLNYPAKAISLFLDIHRSPDFKRQYKDPTDEERRKVLACVQYPEAMMAIFKEVGCSAESLLLLEKYIHEKKSQAKRTKRGAA